MKELPPVRLLVVALTWTALATTLLAQDDAEGEPTATKAATKAFIDGTGPGWKALTLDDFVNVNTDEETWTTEEGVIKCTGRPTGVTRTKDQYTNFEMVAQWRHLKNAGNSGIFIWSSEKALTGLPKGRLPGVGIEVQVLDLGYAEHYRQRHKKEPDWFTSHGDVFPVGGSKMKPFPPVAPNGRRSFPSKNLTKGVGQWNHYYIRAINGEVRLWVNGEEVSGGNECQPATGFVCLESEGAPVEFKGLAIRALP